MYLQIDLVDSKEQTISAFGRYQSVMNTIGEPWHMALAMEIGDVDLDKHWVIKGDKIDIQCFAVKKITDTILGGQPAGNNRKAYMLSIQSNIGKGAGKMVGHAYMADPNLINEDFNMFRLGIHHKGFKCCPDYTGQGYGKEALQLIMTTLAGSILFTNKPQYLLFNHMEYDFNPCLPKPFKQALKAIMNMLEAAGFEKNQWPMGYAFYLR